LTSSSPSYSPSGGTLTFNATINYPANFNTVTSIAVANTGYSAAPSVLIIGVGTGATAAATVSGGSVTGVTITNPGSGYTSAPLVIFDGGGGASPVAAVTVAGGQVTGISIQAAGGSGYTSAPTVALTGDGTGATATATVSGGKISGFTVTNPGSGYTLPPTVVLNGGGGAGGGGVAGVPSPTALGFEIDLPTGFSVASVGGPNIPDVRPSAGQTGKLGFGYIDFPAIKAQFSVTVSYASGLSGDQTITSSASIRPPTATLPVSNLVLPLSQLPAITSAATASAVLNASFTYNITATNSPTSFAATGLPGGLSVNNSTGVISGVPTAAGTSQVTLTATNGSGTGQAFTLSLTVATPAAPTITTQPASQTVAAGQSATFAVVAAGVPAPTYQWRKGGVNISGATNVSYVVTNATLADAGSFSVVVTNGSGSIASDAAALTVTQAPIITLQPVNQVTLAGGTATFTVAATGSGTLSYQWYFTPVSASTPQTIAGATSATYTLNNVQSASLGDYVCVVSNGVTPNATSTAAQLTIASRIVRVASQTAAPGATVVVPIQLVAVGDENAVGFSLEFNTSQLTFVSAAVGADAADATLNSNSTQATSGRVGFAIAKPAGVAFAAGSREVVKVTFTLGSGVANAVVCPIVFGNTPVAREVASAAATELPSGYQSGNVTCLAGFEADMNGNGVVTVTDWVKVGRIVAGLDQAPTGIDFMKADCAPRLNTDGSLRLGNGSLSLTDWVQAGRYAAGLDPLTPVGGPSGP
jgi:hypothetical protein